MQKGNECPTGGSHAFKSFLIETRPPTPEHMEEAGVSNWQDNSEDAELIIKALSIRRYAVACEQCGMTIAGCDVDPNAKVSDEGSEAGEKGEDE